MRGINIRHSGYALKH